MSFLLTATCTRISSIIRFLFLLTHLSLSYQIINLLCFTNLMIYSHIPFYSIILVLHQSPSICKLIMIAKATLAELVVPSWNRHYLSHMVTLSQLPLLYHYFHLSSIAFKLPLLLSVVIIEHPVHNC